MQIMPTEEVELMTSDGVRLVADVYLPDGLPRSAAVVAHGFSGSRREPTVVEQVRDLVKNGFAVVVHDARGHGASGGICTVGDREALDVKAAVDHARTLHHKTVVVGASMGAIGAIRYAAAHPDIDGVVAVSSPAVWQYPRTPIGLLSALIVRTRLGRAIARRHMGVTISPTFSYPEPPIELIKRISAPVAIVHGRRDRVISPLAADELHEAAKSPRILYLVDRMGHAFEDFGRPTVTAATEWVLARSPA